MIKIKAHNIKAEVVAMKATTQTKTQARKETRQIAIQLIELFADDWEDFYRLKLLLRDALDRCCCAFLQKAVQVFDTVQDEKLASADQKIEKIVETTATLMSGFGLNTITMQLYFSKKEEDEDTPLEVVIPFGQAMTLSLLIDGVYDELRREEIIQADFVIAKAQIQHKIEQTDQFNVFNVFAAEISESDLKEIEAAEKA